jgi:hypothetical protein
MSDVDDFDKGLIPEFKKQPVVGATELNTGLRRLELFHVAVASCEVAVRAAKDVEGGRRGAKSVWASSDQMTGMRCGAFSSPTDRTREESRRRGYPHFI